ncbi:(d)CMP kinase [Marinimicrobium sp. ABcell2]|uniref:(d)CMP kinase n=1 Tax=Marinimicrobium sp. ABcell2 TaxID=3069751 RepID=UPI0027B69CA9|nr:(d)CMP kinase [Marinimicrobium sp. ABcell2]MDQ2078055.1 (d)CMP kinase [Marinimicrobium sp. ABcell2]
MNSHNSLAQVVTIDGPSGSGKGTLSQLLAQNLNFHLLDSGALYRLVALAAISQGVDPQAQDKVAELAANLDVEFDVSGKDMRIRLAGRDVTAAIRTEEVSRVASIVAALPPVRNALLQRQRDFRQAPGLVADGRDMGTMVFPDAEVKIFLTASPEARAERRYKQLQERGEWVDMAQLVEDIRTRDQRDSERSVSPLKPADDAYILDSTDMSIGQVLAAMLARVEEAKR